MNNPKKKILFMILTLRYGGAEKVLVNLVNNLDKSKYDITLYSIFDDGVNKEFLDKDIHYQFKFKRVFRGNSHLMKLSSPEFLYKWFVKETYDVVISFLEGPSARIISGCDNIKTKKVAWIHTEQENNKLVSVGFKSYEEAKKLYSRFNYVVGVSENIVSSIRKNISDKLALKVIYNVNDTEKIIKYASEHLSISFSKQEPKIITVGKISKVKGFERLLDAHIMLLKENLKHHIYILGIGEDKESLEKKVIQEGVQNTFHLLGFDKNPYKYMINSDLFICSSRREGFSTAVTEALVLGIPVVSTEVSGAYELLGNNNEYGLVVENSTEGIYQGLKEMLTDEEKRKYYQNQAKIRGSFFSKEETVKAAEDFLDSL